MEQSTQENDIMSKETDREVLMELDVCMNAGILYDYMLYHMYHSMTGILGTLVGLLMIVYYIGYHASVIYLVFGLIVIAYLPINLYMAAKRQALTNTAFRKPLHYAFTNQGIEVSQDESCDSIEWGQMLRAVSTAKNIILYTSKVNATIIPREACEGREVELISIISTHMPPEKVKIKQ